MPRFAANVSTLFTDLPFLERFAAAAQAGFPGAECQFPYHHEAHLVADALAMAGLPLVLFNAPPGNFEAGERGLAALPGREGEFHDSIGVALAYADELDCRSLHVMAGCVGEDDHNAAIDAYLGNLTFAADLAKEAGVRILIEPVLMDNYFLTRPDDAVAVIEQLDHKNIGLQYDVFHAQRSQGNIAEFLERHLDVIKHVQIAGVPGRHEPDKLGEVNWRFIFDLLDSHGYGGWVGAEYNPRAGTLAGLAWARDWGIGAA